MPDDQLVVKLHANTTSMEEALRRIQAVLAPLSGCYGLQGRMVLERFKQGAWRR